MRTFRYGEIFPNVVTKLFKVELTTLTVTLTVVIDEVRVVLLPPLAGGGVEGAAALIAEVAVDVRPTTVSLPDESSPPTRESKRL